MNDCIKCNTYYKIESPIHHAAERNCVKCLKKFLDQGVNIDQVDACGNTPLHRVGWIELHRGNWKNGIPDILKCLLDLGANVNVTNRYAITTLNHVQCGNSDVHKAVARMFIDNGAFLPPSPVPWLTLMFTAHKNCGVAVLLLLGIHKKRWSVLNTNGRDAICVIAQMLWTTRFREEWTY